MKENILQTYSKKLGENYKVTINIEAKSNNNIDGNKLFKLAARQNLKRGFLFVSTVLGKHIPVSPIVSLLMGRILATEVMKFKDNKKIENNTLYHLLNDYFENSANEVNTEINSKLNEEYQKILKEKFTLKEKTLFIGFAETATALGHSVFENFKDNSFFLHTTREYLKDVNKLSEFCEEHSHATEHFLYGNPQKFDRIVLIDDEFTTGNTALNFILELKKNLGVKEYTLLSILDWRNEESIEKLKNFEIENKVIIQCASILKGIIEIDGDINSISNIYNNKKLKEYKKCNSRVLNIILNDDLKSNIFNIKDNRYVNYLKYSGRFLIEHNIECDKIINISVKTLKEYFKNSNLSTEKILFLGSEEFMYIPMKISSYFPNSFFQSTTRSPIYCSEETDYGIKNKIEFENFYTNLDNFLYNLKDNFYDVIVIFFEKKVDIEKSKKLINEISSFGIKDVVIVEFE